MIVLEKEGRSWCRKPPGLRPGSRGCSLREALCVSAFRAPGKVLCVKTAFEAVGVKNIESVKMEHFWDVKGVA